MVECTFHPGRHSVAELNVREKTLGENGEQIRLHLCTFCLEQYDDVVDSYRGGGE